MNVELAVSLLHTPLQHWPPQKPVLPTGPAVKGFANTMLMLLVQHADSNMLSGEGKNCIPRLRELSVCWLQSSRRDRERELQHRTENVTTCDNYGRRELLVADVSIIREEADCMPSKTEHQSHRGLQEQVSELSAS
jgi:hypothetical protein